MLLITVARAKLKPRKTNTMYKKAFLTLALLVLPFTSWQVWDGLNNRLVVHTTADPTSSICYKGGAEYYDGSCVLGGTPTSQYKIRVAEEKASK